MSDSTTKPAQIPTDLPRLVSKDSITFECENCKHTVQTTKSTLAIRLRQMGSLRVPRCPKCGHFYSDMKTPPTAHRWMMTEKGVLAHALHSSHGRFWRFACGESAFVERDAPAGLQKCRKCLTINERMKWKPEPPDRQTGVTTRQMTRAPQGAIYVWPNVLLDYPRRLAENIGRRDLVIVSAASVSIGTVMGKRVKMVVDHAVRWTDGIFEADRYLSDQ